VKWLLLTIALFAVVAPMVLVSIVAWVLATHPWLAVGLAGVTVIRRTDPGRELPTLGSSAALHGTATGVPDDQWPIMVAAAENSGCGVDPRDLAAIAKTESGFGANNGPNPTSGAYGYGQFMPGTFKAEGGTGDPTRPANALPVMARMLCERGYTKDRTKALNSYGGCVTANCVTIGSYTGTYAGYIDQLVGGIVVTPPIQADASRAQIVDLAQQWVALNVPYLYGGSTTAGVDCSGLVQQVYGAVGIQFAHNAALQYNATRAGAIDPSQAQAGDLVFFHDTDPKDPGVDHVGIVIGGGQMIDAPTDNIPVRVESYLTPYWQSHLAGIHEVEQLTTPSGGPSTA
jgi:cell wall-associated NlpC family hydrolase